MLQHHSLFANLYLDQSGQHLIRLVNW